MTDDDRYVVQVYPKARRITLKFVGDCWEYNQELVYNTFVRPLVRRYSDEWMSWDARTTIAKGCYEFTWARRVLDIKGDG